MAEPYPLQIHIGYPDVRARWSVLARLPLGLPVVFFSLLLNIGATLAIWAAILVSGRVPSWLFAYQDNVGRWHTRAAAYLLLVTDDYPVFEGEHPVAYELSGPATVTRWKVALWKFITAFPHFVVLLVLTVALVPVTAVAWLALVTTGRHPRPLHSYAAGWCAGMPGWLPTCSP
jgi:hypothetical protein